MSIVLYSFDSLVSYETQDLLNDPFVDTLLFEFDVLMLITYKFTLLCFSFNLNEHTFWIFFLMTLNTLLFVLDNLAFQQLEIDYIIGESHKELLPNSSGPAAILRIFGVTREGNAS